MIFHIMAIPRDQIVIGTAVFCDFSFVLENCNMQNLLKNLSMHNYVPPHLLPCRTPLEIPLIPFMKLPVVRRHPHAMQNPSDLRGPLVGVDPADELANASVDTGVVSLSTAVAPGDETLQNLGGVDNGAARVARARVLATCSETGAEHVGGDCRGTVLGLASGARDDGDGNLPQGGGQSRAILGQQTPV